MLERPLEVTFEYIKCFRGQSGRSSDLIFVISMSRRVAHLTHYCAAPISPADEQTAPESIQVTATI